MESFFFPHSYTGEGLGVEAFTCARVRKKKPPRSNKGQFFCLKCTVSYTCTRLKYAENSTIGAPLRVPQKKPRKKTKSSIPIS